MRHIKRQKGFILLLVVAMIPLFGIAVTVLTANNRQILTGTRRSALKTQAQLASESGIQWLAVNGDNSVTKAQPQVLTIDHENFSVTCHIELTSQANNQTIFTVTGYAEDKRFSCQHSTQYVLD